MAATPQDYDALIAKAEQVRTAVIELNAICDTLRIPIPQRLALTWADVLTFPDYVRKVAAARAAAAAPTVRHDEPEA